MMIMIMMIMIMMMMMMMTTMMMMIVLMIVSLPVFHHHPLGRNWSLAILSCDTNIANITEERDKYVKKRKEIFPFTC